jgi:hypothetical protein
MIWRNLLMSNNSNNRTSYPLPLEDGVTWPDRGLRGVVIFADHAVADGWITGWLRPGSAEFRCSGAVGIGIGVACGLCPVWVD